VSVRVIVTTRQGARFTERVACETDDPDLARIVAFVHGTAARKGTVVSVETNGETTHAEIATRAHRFKTTTHKTYRKNRTSDDDYSLTRDASALIVSLRTEHETP
jgi:hypothetical protein